MPNVSLTPALYLARTWRTFEVRNGKVYAVGDDSGGVMCTIDTLKQMVELGWMAVLAGSAAERYELTRKGMNAWLANPPAR